MATLTNGSAPVTARLLEQAGLGRFVERTISIDEVRRWKSSAPVYRHAAAVLGVEPERLALVATHAWDVLGAGRAGLLTGWAARREVSFHPAMPPPTVVGARYRRSSAGCSRCGADGSPPEAGLGPSIWPDCVL